MFTYLLATLLFTCALADPAPTSGNYSPAAASFIPNTGSAAPSTTTSAPQAADTTLQGSPLNIVVTSLDCTTWPSNDCTTDNAHYQVLNNISYSQNNPPTPFGSITCNRALASGEQFDISTVAPGADPTTGMIDGQYPNGANSQDWACEQFVSSVTADLALCQAVSGSCYRLWPSGGPPKVWAS